MECVFPMGYNSTVEINRYDTVAYLNKVFIMFICYFVDTKMKKHPTCKIKSSAMNLLYSLSIGLCIKMSCTIDLILSFVYFQNTKKG